MHPNEDAVVVGKGIPKGMPAAADAGNRYALMRSRAHARGKLLSRRVAQRAIEGQTRVRNGDLLAVDDVRFLGSKGRFVESKETAAKGRITIHSLAGIKQVRTRARTELGKADEVKELPIPAWARAAFSPSAPVVANPLDQWAGAQMMAFGGNNAKGKINWPWRRGRMRRGAYEYVQGRQMTYAPMGAGRSAM